MSALRRLGSASGSAARGTKTRLQRWRSSDGCFESAGVSIGGNWEEVRFPGLETGNVYAREISDEAMEPVYRRGDRIVVAPGAPGRRGDRVMVRTKDGEVLAKVLGRQCEQMIELISLAPAYVPRELARIELAWVTRIQWASQ